MKSGAHYLLVLLMMTMPSVGCGEDRSGGKSPDPDTKFMKH